MGKISLSNNPRSLLMVLFVTCSACLGTAEAQAGPTDEGRMMFGLMLGGGNDYFVVGSEVGYFVIDGLRPSLAVSYQSQTRDDYTSHAVEVTPALRYYIGIPGVPLYPFGEVELGVNSFSYEHSSIDQNASFWFYRGGFGGGLLAMLSSNVGLELALGFDKYFGADAELYDIGFLSEGLTFRYGFGLSVSF